MTATAPSVSGKKAGRPGVYYRHSELAVTHKGWMGLRSDGVLFAFEAA